MHITESLDKYTDKDKIKKWNKKEQRRNVRTPAHNILSKLFINVGNSRNIVCPMDSFQILFDETVSIVECATTCIKLMQPVSKEKELLFRQIMQKYEQLLAFLIWRLIINSHM